MIYLDVAKRVDSKYSHHKKEIIMWCDGAVSKGHGQNHFANYKCIKATHCTLETYTILYVNCISTKLKKT